MRKILYIIICLLCGLITFVLIDNKLYDPIKKHGELTTLFKSIGTIKKNSYEDLIGFSLNGEILDIFRYKTSGVVLDSLYPNYGESWDGEFILADSKTTFWKETPIEEMDSLVIRDIIYIPVLGVSSDLRIDIITALRHSYNYYSYIIIDDFHKYLLVYCPFDSYLYYVRKKNIL